MKRELIDITSGTKTFKAYYDPDYKHGCEVCGTKPTVRIRYENGKVFYDGGMCGPCTWGEAETLDPANW